MLCYMDVLCDMEMDMSIGTSGRIVIEVDPELKQELHTTLRSEGTNLKAWFLEQAGCFLAEKGQLRLKLVADAGEAAQE